NSPPKNMISVMRKTHMPSVPASRCCSMLSKWCCSAEAACCSASVKCMSAALMPRLSLLRRDRSIQRLHAARVVPADHFHLLDGPVLVSLPRDDGRAREVLG